MAPTAGGWLDSTQHSRAYDQQPRTCCCLGLGLNSKGSAQGRPYCSSTHTEEHSPREMVGTAWWLGGPWFSHNLGSKANPGWAHQTNVSNPPKISNERFTELLTCCQDPRGWPHHIKHAIEAPAHSSGHVLLRVPACFISTLQGLDQTLCCFRTSSAARAAAITACICVFGRPTSP